MPCTKKKNYFQCFMVFAALSIFMGEGLRSRHLGALEHSFQKLGLPWSLPHQNSRQLADDGSDSDTVTCFKDRLLNIESLRAENARLEQAQSSGKRPLVGQWQGLDLSLFPVAQAEYLTRYGDTLEVQDPAKVRGCRDIRCIIDEAYQKKNSSEAERIYYFYLTMGFPIGVTTQVPEFEHAGRPLKDYLFSDDELIAFDQISAVLSPLYHSMWSYRAIYRVPQGNGVGAMAVGDYTVPGGQGIEEKVTVLDPSTYIQVPRRIYFAQQASYARIVSEKFPVSHPPSISNDNFYLTVIHELTHGLDWVAGPTTGSTDADRTIGALSDTAEWYNLGAWRPKTLTEFNAARNTQRLWEVDLHQPGAENADKGVTGYAHFSPSEDLAETASYFRLKPDGVSSPAGNLKFPHKYKFISDRFYSGRTFDREGLAKFYLEQIQHDVSVQLPATLAQCQGAQSCADQALPALYAKAVNRLKRTDADACAFFDSRENSRALANQFPDLLKPTLAPVLENAPALAQSSAVLKAALDQEVDPREIWLKCLKGNEAEACYATALAAAFDDAASSFEEALKSWLATEKKNYLLTASYASVKERTERETDELLHGITSALMSSEKALWAKCENAVSPPDESASAELLLTPFTGGEHRVPAGTLHCINSAIDAELASVILNFVGRPELKDSNWLSFAAQRVQPLYLDLLRSELERSVKPGLADCYQGICKDQKISLTQDGYSYRGTVYKIHVNTADQSLIQFELNLTSAYAKSVKKFVPIHARFWTSHMPQPFPSAAGEGK